MASPPPSSSGIFKKPVHFQFPEQPSGIHQIPSKSYSNSICKTLVVLVLLLVIPFFPSQAPDFVSQTIFTQFWEIIHLLFIGIAVSYGLFGRKSEKIEISRNDDDSDAYLSGISHLSSIFEDGFGNICCGTDEQDVIQGYYANCDCQCFGDQFLGKSKCVVHGGTSTKIRSFRGKENSCDSIEKNVNQTWSSKYLKTEPLVVVSNGEDFLGENFEIKPLNLPVRSLRSNVIDNDKPELHIRNDSIPKIDTMGKSDIKVKKIRGMVPTNLEKKFDEPEELSSAPWRSRSWKMENEEEFGNTNNPCVHYRPHSVGNFEFEIEHIKSSSSKKVIKISTSPESEILKVGKSQGEMAISASRPKTAPFDDRASFNGSRGRPFISGDNIEEDNEVESLDSDTKSVSRAKSVRTKKPSRHITNQKEQSSSRVNGKLEDFKANSFVRRGKREESEKSPLVNRQNEGVNHHFSMPKSRPGLPDFFNQEKEDIVEQNVKESEVEREEDKGSEFNESCDEKDAKSDVDYDLGSEVDRKAGEFIAKFRQQILLQKGSPVEGCSREFL